MKWFSTSFLFIHCQKHSILRKLNQGNIIPWNFMRKATPTYRFIMFSSQGNLLCILTSFWMLVTPASWSKNFFVVFDLFVYFLWFFVFIYLRIDQEWPRFPGIQMWNNQETKLFLDCKSTLIWNNKPLKSKIWTLPFCIDIFEDPRVGMGGWVLGRQMTNRTAVRQSKNSLVLWSYLF